MGIRHLIPLAALGSPVLTPLIINQIENLSLSANILYLPSSHLSPLKFIPQQLVLGSKDHVPPRCVLRSTGDAARGCYGFV